MSERRPNTMCVVVERPDHLCGDDLDPFKCNVAICNSLYEIILSLSVFAFSKVFVMENENMFSESLTGLLFTLFFI